jgi:hypothetical protein
MQFTILLYGSLRLDFQPVGFSTNNSLLEYGFEITEKNIKKLLTHGGAIHSAVQPTL